MFYIFQDFKKIGEYELHVHDVEACAYSHTGQYLVTGSKDGLLRVLQRSSQNSQKMFLWKTLRILPHVEGRTRNEENESGSHF